MSVTCIRPAADGSPGPTPRRVSTRARVYFQKFGGHGGTAFLVALGVWLTGCVEESATVDRSAPSSVAEARQRDSTLAPLDYDDLELWGCNSARDRDLCRNGATVAVALNSGAEFATDFVPAVEPAIDCFYIYPTVDFRFGEVTNHTDLDDRELPEQTIVAQAAPFSRVCRVFAPFYRQATIGSYGSETSEGVQVFRNAFADVANAFETYLKNWNGGRPLVVLGHSQGAQHATYLLHHYFDGDTSVSEITGATHSSELRQRLVLALPIGFRLFVAPGETRGGSLADVPLCTSSDETGCLIHYRSYSEGYDDFDTLGDFYVDRQLASEGYIERAFELGRDEIACVNPATTAAERPGEYLDIDDAPIPDGDDVRVLSESQFLGATAARGATPDERQAYREYYSATCREAGQGDRYLAVGVHECTAMDTCKRDPIPVGGQIALSGLGLHLWDFTIAMGDLVEQVRVRAAAFPNPAP